MKQARAYKRYKPKAIPGSRQPLNLLVTAGPTREAIDPVRFITNQSTGAMGYAIAGIAARLGHNTTLISGPVHLKPPAGVKMAYVCSAQEMFRQVKTRLGENDCLIMAAAVSDFRPVRCMKSKIKKTQGMQAIFVKKTDDILLWAGKHKRGRIVTGFCMETTGLKKSAYYKMKTKHADFIVANKITSGMAPFGAGPTSVYILGPDNYIMQLKNVDKPRIAEILLDKISELWYKKHSRRP
jgi:phosphopantothenoylcysteine decarboxylase / phosphopantothenate---cysteine ligase